jgi:hypothetical protein
MQYTIEVVPIQIVSEYGKLVEYQNYKQITCSLYFPAKIKTCFVKSQIDSRNYIPSLQYICTNF